VRGILDLAAASAGKIAAKEGLQHEDERITLAPAKLLSEDIGGNSPHLADRDAHRETPLEERRWMTNAYMPPLRRRRASRTHRNIPRTGRRFYEKSHLRSNHSWARCRSARMSQAVALQATHTSPTRTGGFPLGLKGRHPNGPWWRHSYVVYEGQEGRRALDQARSRQRTRHHAARVESSQSTIREPNFRNS
jgi:hypothetical protein